MKHATADPLLIYGATGYTGRRLAEAARRQGLQPVLAGRNERALAEVANGLRLDHRVARLEDAKRLDEILNGIRVVINVAGPFARTAAPMVEACLRNGVHYLDLAGEAEIVEALARRDAEARERGVLIMPAVGYDVVPTDCLAAHVARRLPGAERLGIGIAGLRFLTPGSAKTFVGHAASGVKVRRQGRLAEVVPGSLERAFDFGGARVGTSVGVSLTDVASAYYTTGIPNIEGYYEATPAMRSVVAAWRYFGSLVAATAWEPAIHAWADILWRGPTPSEQESATTVIVAEATDAAGRRVSARLHTPEPYALTSATAIAIALRVLDGDVEPGFQTPARVYGSDFILSFTGVRREDLS